MFITDQSRITLMSKDRTVLNVARHWHYQNDKAVKNYLRSYVINYLIYYLLPCEICIEDYCSILVYFPRFEIKINII